MEGGGLVWDDARKFGYMEIGLMSCCSALACVYNEKLLKFQSEIPPSLQNVAMYVLGGICTLVFTLVPPEWTGGEKAVGAVGASGASLFDMAQWQAIFGNPLVLLQAIVMAVAGVNVGYFL